MSIKSIKYFSRDDKRWRGATGGGKCLQVNRSKIVGKNYGIKIENIQHFLNIFD